MNPEFAKVSSLRVKSVRTTPNEVAIQGQAISVSGYLYALTIVGTAAKPSATILKKIAILPTFVISHKIKPTIDKNPQSKSNLVNFHSAFLFTKEAVNIAKGKKPALKVISDSSPTPCLICAAKAMKGAIDQSRKETLLGFILPFTVSTRYTREPIALIKVPTITKFGFNTL